MTNRNEIVIDGWSNPESKELYETKWPNEPECKEWNENGRQCGGCSFFAPFNQDWGLCTLRESQHHLETVFEHFTCVSYVNEGWGPHSFTTDPTFQCRCGGESSEYWDNLVEILKQSDNWGDGLTGQ